MLNSYLPYIFTECYCFVMGATVLFSLNSSLGSEHQVRQLKYMIYSYMVMLTTDILWALMEQGTLVPPVWLNSTINAILLFSITAGCYFWFRFIEDRAGFSLLSNRKVDAMVVWPLLLVGVLDVMSIFNGWLFFIDADGHFENNDLFIIQEVANYTYLIIPTAVTALKAMRARLKEEKAEYWTYALYMLAPLTASIFEDTFIQVPLLALNILMIIQILFLRIQTLRISNDALTGLNNRRRLNSFLDEKLNRVSQESPLLLFIIDINSFKEINDQYGHVEGDHALQLFSNVLKNVASDYFAFAARYGGDEFCLVMNQENHTCDEVKQKIQTTLIKIQQEKQHSYQMTVSIGCTSCAKPDELPEDVLRRADQMLYESKQRWHDRPHN